MLNDLMFENDLLRIDPDFIADQNYHWLWSTQHLAGAKWRWRLSAWHWASLLWDFFCTSKDDNAVSIPPPVPLRVIHSDALYLNFLYHNCFVFLPYFVILVCCFSVKQ